MNKKEEKINALKKRIEFAEARLSHYAELRDFWEKRLEQLEEQLDELKDEKAEKAKLIKDLKHTLM